ncbi:ABC transporter permease [Candidatus Bipolaricaulota bacterium]|nr:ABC transporter permease [Candidatus Bipolaricaulota bacterium]
MLAYTARRLGEALLVILGVVIFVFVVSHLLPANPAKVWAGSKSSNEQVERIKEEYHLDEPVHKQLYFYLIQLGSGDLGLSPVTNNPVFKDLQRFAPATLELALISVFLGSIGGIYLGVISAVHKDSWVDQLSRVIALAGVSLPLFLLALLAQLLFSFSLNWLPFAGRIGQSVASPPNITGFYLLDSLISGQMGTFVSVLRHLALPSLLLSFSSLVRITRITRSSMVEVLSQDYVLTARSKGLKERMVIYRHALRNAISSSISLLGLTLVYTFGGTVVIEVVFGWPGMGRYAASAIHTLDFPALMGFVLVVSTVVAIVNLIVDLMYGVMDPRIKYA